MTRDLCTNVSLVSTAHHETEVVPLETSHSSREYMLWNLNEATTFTDVRSTWPISHERTCSPAKSTLYWSDAIICKHYNDPGFLNQLCFASGLTWSDFQGWELLSGVLLLAKPRSATDASPSQSQSQPIVPLWSLDLKGYSGGYRLDTFPALAAFTDVTSLSMKGCNTEFNVIMCIFQACPRLTHLRFDGDGLIHCVGTEIASSVGNMGPAPQLKALSMTRPHLFVCDLLHLLGTQSSLTLLELKDLSMSESPLGQPHLPNLRTLTRGILKYLKNTSTSIQSLYAPFSHHVGSIDSTRSWSNNETFEDEIAQACPTVPRWKIMADESGNFPFLRSLTQYHNVVTSLDLECENGSTLWLKGSSDLDNFLCQESQPLLHLRLPTMHGRPESMDVFYDRDSDMGWIKRHPGDMRHRRRFWACRNLKTLSIGFSGFEKCDIPRSNYFHATHQARLIFGYLVRVCPDLEELVMVMNLNNLFLETGFCLLTRMRRLRRLEVKLDWCSWPVAERIEIDWLNAPNVVRDAGVGAQWQTRHWDKDKQPWDVLHDVEERIVAGRERNLNSPGQRNMTADDAEEEERWIHVGLFTDVQSASFELQWEASEGSHCWPAMESLRILDNAEDAEQAELIIKNLRPEISCQSFKAPPQWDWK